MRFVISRELDGKWTWHLLTEDGMKLAASIPRFSSWDDCHSAVSFIRSSRFPIVLTNEIDAYPNPVEARVEDIEAALPKDRSFAVP
ncbi:MAG: hypothetical protein HY961_21925 [Ignavibacteriae bacterium]|nr:hypothetical protein [Ignavibacteriota bacterium]